MFLFLSIWKEIVFLAKVEDVQIISMIIALSEKLNSSPMILGCADIRLSCLHSGSSRASQPLWMTLKNRKLRSVTLRCKTFLYIFQLCKFNYPSGKQQTETIQKLNCVFKLVKVYTIHFRARCKDWNFPFELWCPKSIVRISGLRYNIIWSLI